MQFWRHPLPKVVPPTAALICLGVSLPLTSCLHFVPSIVEVEALDCWCWCISTHTFLFALLLVTKVNPSSFRSWVWTGVASLRPHMV